MNKEKLAIIGSGISGLSLSFFLSDKYDVSLYEKNDYFGGHTRTKKVDNINIDTGFIVYNDKNYPLFKNFLKSLNVDSENSNMSFSFSLYNPRLEYSGKNIFSLFSQIENIFSYSFWKFIFEIRKFYQFCKNVDSNDKENITIKEFLKKNKFSDNLINFHIYPLISSIWSSDKKKIENFPLRSFLSFFNNHDLFNLKNRPQWKCVKGGSKNYIDRILDKKLFYNEKNSKIIKISRNENNILIKFENSTRKFNKIIFANHANEILQLLEKPTKDEIRILQKFKYSSNTAYLHSDESLMPKNKKIWSSWNFIEKTLQDNSFSITYWMNKLQNINTKKNYFVTLNPIKIPHNFYDKTIFEHINFDLETISAQKEIFDLQGLNNTWFCGSYLGYGFHEDGIQSAAYIASKLGVNLPWKKTVNFYNRIYSQNK